jgi:putative lipoprotein (rSAM/lipoprotein system)
MIRLSEKSRRVFRAVYRGLGVTAISLVFQACYGPVQDYYAMYGMPPDIQYEELVIRGCIRSPKTDKPVRGISIWIEGVTTGYAHLTDANGEFYIYAPIQDNYTIVFTDIDGDKNGQFKPYTTNLTKEEAKALFESPLIIELEEVDAE